MSLYDNARSIGSACFAATALLTASAKYWIDPASDRTSLHLLGYIVDTYGIELTVLCLVICIWWLPDRMASSFRRRWRNWSSARLQAVKFYWRRRRVWDVLVLICPSLCLAFAVGSVGMALYEPTTKVMAAKAALLLKYHTLDLRQYLYGIANSNISARQFTTAQSYYRSIASLFGDVDQKRAESLSNDIDTIRGYADAWMQRARDIERQSGPNRRSFYMYLEAAQVAEIRSDVWSSLAGYLPIIERVSNAQAAIHAHCRVVPAADAMKMKEAIARVSPAELGGFATSTFARSSLVELAGASESTVQESASALCILDARFGKVLYDLTPERSSAEAWLAQIRKAQR